MSGRNHKPTSQTTAQNLAACPADEHTGGSDVVPAGELAPARPAGRRPLLLIADDEAMVRRVLERIARKLGYDVLMCETGTEAIEVAAKQPPDVALVDLRMPGADGLSVLRSVRSDAPQAAVIIMTAYAAIDSAVEAIKLGAREYMPKPLDFSALRTTLAELSTHIDQTSGLPAVEAGKTGEPAAAPDGSAPAPQATRPCHLLLVKSGGGQPSAGAKRSRSLLRVVTAASRPAPPAPPAPPALPSGSRPSGSGKRRSGPRTASSRRQS